MEALHLHNYAHDTRVGLVVAGVSRQPAYMEALNLHKRSLLNCDVRFVGSVSDRDLATLYRGASVYLSMSDHEGFGIPPVEAMAMGIPVVVKGVGALPETVGEGGLVLPSDASPALAAEAIAEVRSNEELRLDLIGRGFRQVERLIAATSGDRVRDLLLGVRQ
jgi:glycosyltransferase involved in cell wall biosynthesis